MDFTTVIQTRRSVREYADKSIPDEVVGRVLEAARLAPSACNFQPWRFVVVKDPAARSKIADAANGQQFVAKAPVVIVCCGKRYPQKYNWIGDELYLIDMGIALDHLMLAARNEGLGTCCIGSFQDKPIKKLLDVPADHDIIMLLPIGYPASEGQFTPTSERLPVEQVFFPERFGKAAGK